jgi:DNA methylase
MTPNLSAEFLKAVHTREPVAGYTHNFYRYPARFSPLFARAAITAFSRPGDIIYDPFMGGGTTLVEARALGRKGIGTDISSLATFVSEVKTALLSPDDISIIRSWAAQLANHLNLHRPSVRATSWLEAGYQRNISGRSTWPTRKLLELALVQIEELPTSEQRRFSRCVLLKTAQWALDCRTHIPTAAQFRQQFFIYFEEMLEGASSFAEVVTEAKRRYNQGDQLVPLCINRSVIGVETEDAWADQAAPSLVLTSPPYPGVHVLYHRWQIQGRKETPAPFWIADRLDGNGASYYTFGDRHAQNLTGYYEQIRAAFTSIASVAGPNTIVVQMVAFSDPSWQLPRYLDVMNQVGFTEIVYPDFSNYPDGRLRRFVPNRKWYADQKGEIAASKEVVLFHGLSR